MLTATSTANEAVTPFRFMANNPTRKSLSLNCVIFRAKRITQFRLSDFGTFVSMSVFRENLLKDRVAFVTGGGSGIGQRMAERFAEHGAKVMLVGRRQEKLDAAAAAIRSTGGTAATHATDVRDYAGMEAALKSTHDQFGEIDIVLCGAAGNFPAPVLGMSANGFKAVIDIDLIGTFN